jgi:GTPase SAR1 family protein
MIRTFTENEKNILYKNIPLQKQGYVIGWEAILFIILNIVLFTLGLKVILFDHNPFLTESEEDLASFLYFFIGFIPVGVISFLLITALFISVRWMIVYPQYGKYAIQKTFDTARIEIIQKGEEEDFVIQIFNTKEEKIEIKIYLKIYVESTFKNFFLEEIEKYRILGAKNIDLSFHEILQVIAAKSPSRIAYINSTNFSTDIKLDSNEEIDSFHDFLKTKYHMIYSQKTKELLFINFSGDSIEKEIDVVVKDIESKIVYFVDQE